MRAVSIAALLRVPKARASRRSYRAVIAVMPVITGAITEGAQERPSPQAASRALCLSTALASCEIGRDDRGFDDRRDGRVLEQSGSNSLNVGRAQASDESRESTRPR